MKKHTTIWLLNLPLIPLMLASINGEALAGPFSGPTFDPGKIDSAIPGFIGPDGLGEVTPNNRVNPIFKGWATGFDYRPTSGVSSQWRTPEKTLGPVTGAFDGIASLGELDETEINAGVAPGQITLTFAAPIYNGAGADFAVFENGFESGVDLFGELAFVEVSSNGVDFARFPSISLTPDPLIPFGLLDATNVYNLAGKHVNNGGIFQGEAFGSSWGTPFDLEDLSEDPLVLAGLVSLERINFVRIVDIPGNGAFLDSQGNPIFDPYPTPIPGSGGFDLEAVGVINTVPEPSSVLALLILGWVGLGLTKKY